MIMKTFWRLQKWHKQNVYDISVIKDHYWIRTLTQSKVQHGVSFLWVCACVCVCVCVCACVCVSPEPSGVLFTKVGSILTVAESWVLFERPFWISILILFLTWNNLGEYSAVVTQWKTRTHILHILHTLQYVSVFTSSSCSVDRRNSDSVWVISRECSARR